MQKQLNWKVYNADKVSGLGIWFRRKVLGHRFVEGRELKKLLTKTQHADQRKFIKNTVLYGVKIKRS